LFSKRSSHLKAHIQIDDKCDVTLNHVHEKFLIEAASNNDNDDTSIHIQPHHIDGKLI